MPIQPRLLASLTALLLSLAGPVSAQTGATARLTLTVLDHASGAPVRNARVEVAGVRAPSFTNGRGVARLDAVPAGNRIVTVTRLGYTGGRVVVELPEAGEVEQTMRLSSEAVQVEGVAAAAARRDPGLDQNGFYQRQRRGFGAHMTWEEIDQVRPSRSIDLFRRMRGFTVSYDRRGNPFLHTTRGPSGFRCDGLIVLLDGIQVTSRMVSPAAALEMIPPETIAGIEAYSGPANIPAQYNMTGSACGVVVVWTRTGGAQ